VGGIAIVLLAIVLDRITQSLTISDQQRLKKAKGSWWERWRRALLGGKGDDAAPKSQNWDDTQVPNRV
ncbi:MAG: hypothetical protein AB7K04_09435, partial [Pseudorhodoplanes sp.]